MYTIYGPSIAKTQVAVLQKYNGYGKGKKAYLYIFTANKVCEVMGSVA